MREMVGKCPMYNVNVHMQHLYNLPLTEDRSTELSCTCTLCYSYSPGPGIYGSKPSESEGVARGQGRFTLP